MPSSKIGVGWKGVRRKAPKYTLCMSRQQPTHVRVEVMMQLISPFISSRLDYCNALLIGLPLSTIAPLQRVQNAAARLLLALSRRDHVYTSSPGGAALAARRVQNPVQAGTGDVHNPYTPLPRLPH